ncbi:unnamed protein product [Moneuplotes crassus]|uniref:Peptidase M48 domain-containing protein n=2 Tax=Euplotes crassus TaxID=5936 RepID=A0AAD1XLC3_EUPCR|nr:unnamed protein product [Moneuplotes crassus]
MFNRVAVTQLKRNYRNLLASQNGIVRTPARFCSTKKEEEISYESQAPIDDTKDYEANSRLARQLFLFIPVTMFVIYKSFFVKNNPFSKEKEYCFISDNFEKKYIGSHAAKLIEKKIGNRIYKQETEETQRVKTLVDTVIQKNNIKKYLEDLQVKVIHIPTFGVVMTLDQTLFVSIKTLETCNDDELVMLICHELSHYLLSHSLKKSLKIIYYEYFKSLGKGFSQQVEWYKRMVSQYKNGAIYNKFEERRADILSHELAHRAGFDILKGIEVYGEFTPSLGHPDYSHYEMSKRLLKNFAENANDPSAAPE